MSTTINDYLQKAEAYAQKKGHIGLFLTLTVPSQLHKEASPKEAHDWLQKKWKRARADMVARGCSGTYGIRISEPDSNGKTRWHVVMWHEATEALEIQECIRRHWDKQQGSKFTATQLKSGFAVRWAGVHIYKDMAQSGARLEAWASTWGIRRIQTFGDANLTTQGAQP